MKCLINAVVANIDQPILKYIMVGNVLIVDVKTSVRLDIKANIYSHQNCTPNSRPGKIITSFVENAQNSIMLVLFQ